MRRKRDLSRYNGQRRDERAAEPSVVEAREQFRAAMRSMAATVTIVSTKDARGRFGMTATSVTSVSMEPPSLLVSINRQASLHESLIEARAFCVNILSNHQKDHCLAFSGAKKGADRFLCGDWREECGLPFLEQAQASIFCRLEKQVDYGTHTIFIGRVDRVRLGGLVSPLVYMNGGFLLSQQDGGHTEAARGTGGQ